MGALGRLAQDEALYDNANRPITSVERAASEFANLAEDVRKHPKRYLNQPVVTWTRRPTGFGAPVPPGAPTHPIAGPRPAPPHAL